MNRRRYSRGSRALIAGLLLAAAALPGMAQRAIILVRHAEKLEASGDSVLSEAGRARAWALAGMLAPAGVTTIYASEFRRTIETAEPLAAVLKITVQTFPAGDTAGLVEQLHLRHADEIVLVVGHSNTLPDLMKALGHPVTETIEDDDFGSLFILVPRPGLLPVVTRLKY
ncbi:MAG: phosphoglycerate mutase family protein [Candidatus Aminicenantales bacterium]